MNYYEILGVSKTASNTEIKKAYKKLIKKYHPDIYPGDKNYAERKTAQINVAYDTLSNEELRRRYDEETFNQTTENTSSTYNPYQSNYKNYSYDTKKYYDPHYSNYYTNKKTYSDYTYMYTSKLIDKFFQNKKRAVITIIVICLFLLIFLMFKIQSLSNYYKPLDNYPDTNYYTPTRPNTSYRNDLTYEEFEEILERYILYYQ